MRQVAGLFLLLPFLLTALLPHGFMPSTTSDGWFTVTICTSEGMRTVVLDETGQEVPDPTGQDDDTSRKPLCVFSFLSADTNTPSSVDFSAKPSEPILAWSVIGYSPWSELHSYRLGARAPPVLA